MGRTATPATPGDTPVSTTDTPVTKDLETNTEDLGQQSTAATALTAAPPAASSDADVQAQLDALRKENEDIKALVRQLNRNQAVTSAEPVKLPTMAETLKQKPTVAVLTEEGWFVPAVHPTDRKIG